MSEQQQQAKQTAQREHQSEQFDAAQEDAPDQPTELSKPGWKGVLKRSVAEFGDDKGTDLAAALTYFAVLSLFPALLALTSLLGVFGQGPATTQALVQVIQDMGATEEQLAPVSNFLAQQQESSGAGLALFIGLAGALWAASNYVNAFSRASNAIYEVEEGRPIWKLRPMMLLVTLVELLLVVLVAFALVATGGLAEAIGNVVGLGSTAVTIWNIAKWPVILLIVIVIVGLLYWATPNVQQPKPKWVSPGALVAIVVWVIATALFGFYVANFGNYNATYGALAGVILLLLWLYITNIALVFGAEVDAELERGRELEAGMPAEETILLPPRDSKGSKKKAKKNAELVSEARALRMRAAQDRSEAGQETGLPGRGRDADQQ